MPKTLENFPALPTQRYPWDELMNGQVWQLTRGEDYDAKTSTLVANARAQAKRRGGTLRTRILASADREQLVIQFLQP
jgi:hypothetical protein